MSECWDEEAAPDECDALGPEMYLKFDADGELLPAVPDDTLFGLANVGLFKHKQRARRRWGIGDDEEPYEIDDFVLEVVVQKFHAPYWDAASVPVIGNTFGWDSDRAVLSKGVLTFGGVRRNEFEMGDSICIGKRDRLRTRSILEGTFASVRAQDEAALLQPLPSLSELTIGDYVYVRGQADADWHIAVVTHILSVGFRSTGYMGYPAITFMMSGFFENPPVHVSKHYWDISWAAQYAMEKEAAVVPPVARAPVREDVSHSALPPLPPLRQARQRLIPVQQPPVSDDDSRAALRARLLTYRPTGDCADFFASPRSMTAAAFLSTAAVRRTSAATWHDVEQSLAMEAE